MEKYRNSLKSGDITLLGLITDGGQGLATANNGKFVGVIEGSKEAKRVLEARPKKLYDAIKKHKINELAYINSVNDAKGFLSSKSKIEIRNLFDELKEKYGRDIFGRGYLYKIISKDEIAKIDKLSEEEKTNGIDNNKPYWVLYDKGDKDGNKWYLESPYYINWSKESIEWLKTSPKSRWQGYNFFFKEGFCWNNVLNPNARLIKCRLKGKSVNDVASMTLYSQYNNISSKFFVSLLNSNFIFDYCRNYINQSVSIQINDIRQLPIIIPTEQQLNEFEKIFNQAYAMKKKQFAGEISNKEANKKLDEIQKILDEKIYQLYELK